jgi:hypothetical protein
MQYKYEASIAQPVERETEDLKVTCSIHVRGIILFFLFSLSDQSARSLLPDYLYELEQLLCIFTTSNKMDKYITVTKRKKASQEEDESEPPKKSPKIENTQSQDGASATQVKLTPEETKKRIIQILSGKSTNYY